MATTKLCTAGFTKSIDEKGDLFLEGWANKSVVDRGNDIIRKDAWNLDNFKKNGMILFNHDRMQPVGKAVLCEARDEGLYIKAKLSKSSHPDIQKVRDLVKEGVLNAFSVGFDARNEQKSADGVNEIKDAELYECSIVSVPMNQDSLFEVSVKDIAGMTLTAARDKILRFKGALVAAEVHSQIYDMVEAGKDRDALLDEVAAAASVDRAALTEVLAGNVEKVPEPILGAFASVLGMDAEALAKLESAAPAAEPEVEEEEEEGLVEDACKPKVEKADGEMACHALIMPKGSMSEEDAIKAAADAGYVTDMPEHDADNYKFIQVAADKFQGEMKPEDIGDGAMVLMGQLIAVEDEIPEDAKPPADAPAPDASADKKPVKPDEDKKPSKDDKKPKKPEKKQANQETQPTVPLQGGGPGSVNENPYLEQTKQTNVLLGVLIGEIQKLADAIGKLAAPAPVAVPEQPMPEKDEPNADAALAKMIEGVAESYLALDARFKSLGV